MNEHTQKLEAPVSYTDIIEAPLLEAFPRVWEGTYYFDPGRGRRADEEAGTVFRLVSQHAEEISLRALQYFNDRIFSAVQNGTGQIIPFSAAYGNVACYIMTERQVDGERLRDFFGEAALDRRDLRLTARLYEEFAARHETYHSVEQLESGFAPGATRLQSECGADAHGLLGMFRDYGSLVYDFALAVLAGRDHQFACEGVAHYRTQDAIHGVLGYVAENGLDAVRTLSAKDVFLTARRLATTPSARLTA